jgi:hypothetical protein
MFGGPFGSDGVSSARARPGLAAAMAAPPSIAEPAPMNCRRVAADARSDSLFFCRDDTSSSLQTYFARDTPIKLAFGIASQAINRLQAHREDSLFTRSMSQSLCRIGGASIFSTCDTICAMRYD